MQYSDIMSVWRVRRNIEIRLLAAGFSDVVCRAMVGEYLLYVDSVLIGGINDDRLLVKKVPGNEEFAMEEAIKMMGAEVIVPLEFEYYIDALIALEKGDNRKCILDSATAVEISLTKEIEKILTNQAPFVNVKELLNDYQGLNKRFSLLKKTNGNVSGLNIKTLNENRNRIIHAGQKAELAVTSKVLVDAKRVLDRFSKFW